MTCRTSGKSGSQVLIARCEDNSWPEWSGSEVEVVNNQARVSAPEEPGLTTGKIENLHPCKKYVKIM